MRPSFLAEPRLSTIGCTLIALFACQSVCQGEFTTSNRNDNSKRANTAVITENKAKTDVNPNQSIKPVEMIKVKAKKNLRGSVNRNAVTLCKQCGLLMTGQLSCCGKGGSWQGRCVSQYESKASVDKNNIYTWLDGVDACKGWLLRSDDSHNKIKNKNKPEEESQAKTDANRNQPINHAEKREVNAKKSLRVDVNRNAKTLCKQCGTLVTGQISCCAKGGSWQGSCVSQYESKASVDNNNIHTWAEGVEICKENKAKTDANTKQSMEPAETIEMSAKRNPSVGVKRNAKTLCKQCGILATGQVSCCGKGGSWQGSCVSQYESKASVGKSNIHTWAEGIDACNARILRSKVADVGFSESEDPQISEIEDPQTNLEINSDITVSATSHEKMTYFTVFASLMIISMSV